MKSLIKGYGREKKVGNHWSRHPAHRWQLGCQPYALAVLYPQKDP
jgi:hypothetical protein